MPTYHLRCILGILNGQLGCEIDSRAIEAESLDDAIALAKLYTFPDPTMRLLSASLSAPTGILIWSLRSEVPPQNGFEALGG